MTRTILGLASFLAVAGVAHADAPALPFTLTTVDEFERLDDQRFSLTGLVSGESTPRTMQLTSGYSGSFGSSFPTTRSADACERAALIMSTHPGRFTLRITLVAGSYDDAVTCRLIRQAQ
jgi:hypothetical protein